MTEPHRAVIARLSADFAAMSQYMARVSTDLTELDRLLSERPAAAPRPRRTAPQYRRRTRSRSTRSRSTSRSTRRSTAPHRRARPAGGTAACRYRSAAPTPRPQRSEGWIGKVLAVAGVAVTLIGVVLLLVLAAQAGILRPEIRVGRRCGARRRRWWPRRAGCTRGPAGGSARSRWPPPGVAAAYMDVIAVTTIYDWVPAPVGLAHRRGHRRRRPDPGPALGLRAPRPAGAGAADRAGAGGHRRHHAAARRVHARAVGGVAAGAARQGLDLAARRAHRGQHACRCSSRWSRLYFDDRRRPVAGRRMRRRGACWPSSAR